MYCITVLAYSSTSKFIMDIKLKIHEPSIENTIITSGKKP